MPDTSDPEPRTAFFSRVRRMMEQLAPEAIRQDGPAYLGRLSEVASGRAALVGYCKGAGVDLRIAAAHPDRVVAFGGFHAGGLVTDAQDSPHRSVQALRAEVNLGHADEDPSMNSEQIAELDQALDEAEAPHRTEVYVGARHGYTMADTPAWNEAAYGRHLENLLALLFRTLPSSDGSAG